MGLALAKLDTKNLRSADFLNSVVNAVNYSVLLSVPLEENSAVLKRPPPLVFSGFSFR